MNDDMTAREPRGENSNEDFSTPPAKRLKMEPEAAGTTGAAKPPEAPSRDEKVKPTNVEWNTFVNSNSTTARGHRENGVALIKAE
jgi:hypothetical protein